MIIAATGHRLGPRTGGYSTAASWKMRAIAANVLGLLRPERVLSGMAIGWDQAVAAAAIDLGLPMTAVIPFEGQDDLWPTEARMEYRDLRLCADDEHIVCSTDLGRSQPAWAFRARNQWLVTHSDTMLALWDGGQGGTDHCLRFARLAERPVINMWETFSGGG